MRLWAKIMVALVGSVLFSAAVIVTCVVVQVSNLSEEVEGAQTSYARDFNESIVRNVQSLCASEHVAIEEELRIKLRVALQELEALGGLRQDPDGGWTDWVLKEKQYPLPRLRIGDIVLQPLRDFDRPAILVDRVREVTGADCSLYQATLEGNMLRVATTHVNVDGQRHISVLMRDGGPSAAADQEILSQIKESQESWVGRRLLSGTAFFAAIRGLYGADGKLQGMLEVTIDAADRLEVIEAALHQIAVPDGFLFVKRQASIVDDALPPRPYGHGASLTGAELGLIKQLNTPGGSIVSVQRLSAEENEQPMIASGVWFAPWDWVVGVLSSVQETSGTAASINAAFDRTFTWVLGALFVTILLAVLLGLILARTIASPITNMTRLVKEMAHGDFSHSITVSGSDEVGQMAAALREMIEMQQTRIAIANAMADGDLTRDIPVSSDHDIFGKALRNMAAQLASVLARIQDVGEAVSNGSRQVSDSSQSLSQGATEQAASLQEITSSTTQIGSQTKSNAENATQASQLSDGARTCAEGGNKQMQKMLHAMEEIQTASARISKIIKVIDDIAFQTNLLALNAAVEAARAGRHGKGFAVVAEEVRNLAGRSAKAARETAELVESSADRVGNGMEIAQQSAQALEDIVTSITKVSDLVSEIAAASEEQAQGVAQVNAGLHQIDGVTQQNMASAEETASAAEELASQAADLRNMLSRFRLRENQLAHRGPRISRGDDRRQVPGLVEGRRLNVRAEPDDQVVRPSDIISLDDDEFGKY